MQSTTTPIPTPADTHSPRPMTVARRTPVADGVVELTLQAPDGQPLPAWTPGAHLDLLLGPGLTRQYSLCGDPADRSCYRVAVLREPQSRGGSSAVHDNVAVGDILQVQGPRNNFELRDADEYLFIAGGIGITPLIPMIAEVHSRGLAFTLVYGGRNRASMAYAKELQRQYPDHVEINPQDESGLLDLPGVLADYRPHRHVYTCGPSPLLDAVETYCTDWPAGTVHMERFRGKEPAADAAANSFEVELAHSGLTLTVPPDRSILDLVQEAGVDVLTSCREGTCGSCETPILDGEADHRDSLLSQSEKDAQETMFICVSRARSTKLVLDL